MAQLHCEIRQLVLFALVICARQLESEVILKRLIDQKSLANPPSAIDNHKLRAIRFVTFF